MANKALALAALMVVRQMDKSLREDILDDIVNNIYGFAGGAVAASLDWTWHWRRRIYG